MHSRIHPNALWRIGPLVAFAFAMACWTQAQAQGPMFDQVRTTINAVSRGQTQVLSTFQGPSDLIGAVVAPGSGRSFRDVVWLTHDGAVVLSGGRLLSSNGNDLTKEALYSTGILLRPRAINGLVAKNRNDSVTLGARGPLLIAFIDPNCVYCNVLYNALTSYIEAGTVRVRYVLVGTLKDTSVDRAASILAAPKPAAALAANEAKFNHASEEGAWPILTKVSSDMKLSVTESNELLRKMGAGGTPALLYCSAASRDFVMSVGVPSNMKALIREMSETGCSHEPTHD